MKHTKMATDPNELLREAKEKTRKELKRPNILVCGYTGTGKTSLIQSICGKAIVPDSKIGAGCPLTKFYDNYESPLINFYDSRGFEAGQTEEEFTDGTSKFIRDIQDKPDVDQHIHIVWYCIQGSGARVTDCDINLIKNIFTNVIVVITKRDITRDNQFEAMKDRLLSAGVSPSKIIAVSDQNLESHKKLVDLTYEMLPSAYKDAFMSAQNVNLEKKDAIAQVWIHASAASAAAVGATPIPISDAFIISGIQVALLVKLCHLYNFLDESVKTPMMILATEQIGILTAGSLVKFFPAIGSFIQATVAATLTEALGHLANNYLKDCFMARAKNEPLPKMYGHNEIKKWILNIGGNNK
ncbi:MAG: hypothetical protein HQK49_19635 [Oligoflexia bacterium]|nr:hypothetical protein [Oligoflexia bacterium]